MWGSLRLTAIVPERVRKPSRSSCTHDWNLCCSCQPSSPKEWFSLCPKEWSLLVQWGGSIYCQMTASQPFPKDHYYMPTGSKYSYTQTFKIIWGRSLFTDLAQSTKTVEHLSLKRHAIQYFIWSTCMRLWATSPSLSQDPKEADPMMRVQNDLDETKIVLVGCGRVV